EHVEKAIVGFDDPSLSIDHEKPHDTRVEECFEAGLAADHRRLCGLTSGDVLETSFVVGSCFFVTVMESDVSAEPSGRAVGQCSPGLKPIDLTPAGKLVSQGQPVTFAQDLVKRRVRALKFVDRVTAEDAQEGRIADE